MIKKSRSVFAVLLLCGLLRPLTPFAQGILDEWSSVKAPEPPILSKVHLEAKDTALLVLDVAKHTCNNEVRPRCIQMLPKVKQLMTKVRSKGMTVIYALGIQPTPGTPADIWPEAAMVGDEPWVRSGPDKFLKTDLEKILTERGIKTVVVTGAASHGAVLYTIGGSVFRGLKVIVPVDVIAAESTYAEQYTVWHLQNAPRMAANVKLTSVDLID